MLTTVEVRTSQGTLLTLPLEDVSNGLVVESIEGLDPVKATLVSSSFARLDGEQFQSSRREARNIKLRLGIEPDYVTETVRDIRTRLYGFFMPKSEVSLRFIMDDGLEVDISGRVESFETPLFSKEPAVDISVMCFNPDFYDPNLVAYNGMSTDGTGLTSFPYPGTVETGVVFEIFPDRIMDEVTIYHHLPDGSVRSLEFGSPMQAGDVVTISTVSGDKYATLTRGGVDTSVLYGITPQSNWVEFLPGDNLIRVYVEGIAVPYRLSYTAKYGGL